MMNQIFGTLAGVGWGAAIILYILLSNSEASNNALRDKNSSLEARNAELFLLNQTNSETLKELGNKQKAADQSAELLRAEKEKLYKRYINSILEIRNANDNGPIPGVLQRTIDGVRERSLTSPSGSGEGSKTSNSR